MSEIIAESFQQQYPLSPIKQYQIQDSILNFVRKLKSEATLISKRALHTNFIEKIVVLYNKQIVQNFQMVTVFHIDKNNRAMSIKSYLNHNSSINMFESIQQKKMGIKYLFTRLMINSWSGEPNICINVNNGVFIISHTMFVSKDFFTYSSILMSYFKSYYEIQTQALKIHLPKLMSLSAMLPEKYIKIYQNDKLYLKKLPYCHLQDKQMLKKMKKYYFMSSYKQQFQKILQDRLKIDKIIIPSVPHMKFNNQINDLSCMYLFTEKFDESQLKMSLSQSEKIEIQKKIEHRPPFDPQNQDENKFIYNFIEIKDQQPLQYFKKGGFNHLYIAKTKFIYKQSEQALEQMKVKTKKRKIHKNEEVVKRKAEIVKWLAIKKPITNQYTYVISHQIEILQNFRSSASPYLLKYYYCPEFNNTLFMEPSNAPNLAQFLINSSKTVSLVTKLFLLMHISNGLTFLKKKNICHMDLKPQNVLAQIRLLNVRLIDFGQSYEEELCSKFYKPGHTLPYAPPQALRVQRTYFTSKSDVFSFGILMFSVLFSKLPFTTLIKLKKKYIAGQYIPFIFYLPQELGWYGDIQLMRLLLGLIMKCLEPNQEDRPDLQWISLILFQSASYLLKIG